MDGISRLELASILVAYCHSEEPPEDCHEKFHQAHSFYQKALTLEPDNPEIHKGLGMVMLSQGLDVNKALQHVQFAYDQMPWSSHLSYLLGKIHLRLHNIDKAKQLLLRASYRTHDELFLSRIKEALKQIDPTLVEDHQE